MPGGRTAHGKAWCLGVERVNVWVGATADGECAVVEVGEYVVPALGVGVASTQSGPHQQVGQQCVQVVVARFEMGAGGVASAVGREKGGRLTAWGPGAWWWQSGRALYGESATGLIQVPGPW